MMLQPMVRETPVNFQDAIRVCFSKYAEFNGRASRPEFWWFFLFLLIGGLVCTVISSLLSTLFSLATLVPSLAAGARRLQDAGLSPWLLLLLLVPALGFLVLLVMWALPPKSSISTDSGTAGWGS